VQYACALSSSSCDFQNRRLLRRMYQLVRSSMNLTKGRTARCKSYPSIAATTSCVRLSSELRIAVEHVGARLAPVVRRPSVNVGVRHEEAVRIPQRNQDMAKQFLDARFREAQVLGSDHRRVDQVQPQASAPYVSIIWAGSG